jgi:protein-S-isoprenylcysteine O-methyltransferase Ste14
MPAAEDSAKVPVFPPAIYLVALAVGFLLQRLAPLSPGESWQAAGRLTGIAVTAAGAAFMISAVALFRGAGTTPNPTQPTTALVFAGPYRLTRNPMYVGMTLITAGIGLWALTLWPALMALVAAAVMHRVVIPREEGYLVQKFGAPYEEYCQRVRRWL